MNFLVLQIRRIIAFFHREYEGIKAFIEDKPL